MTQTIAAPQIANFDSVINYFIDLIAEKVAEKISVKPQEVEQKIEKKRLNGVRGIAKHLHISTGTAQKMIHEKSIPVYYTGCKLFGYDTEIEAALKN